MVWDANIPEVTKQKMAMELRASSLSEAGTTVFDMVLAKPCGPQIIVSPEPLDRRMGNWGSDLLAQALMANETPRGGANARHYARPSLSTPYVAPRNEEERMLAEVWQDLFMINPIGIDDDFFELGGESLLAAQIGVRIGERCGVSLAHNTLLEARTITMQAKTIRVEQSRK